MEKDKTQNSVEKPVKLAFRLSYIGTGFFGSQYQPDRRTVEGEVLEACLRSKLFESKKEGRLLFSGRTDRGVHSAGQVISFRTAFPERAVKVLNWQLPPDIWVTGYNVVDDEFHPRYAPKSRTYHYYFSEMPPFIDLMKKAAFLFKGTHDFTCFAKLESGKSPVRKVFSCTMECGEGHCMLKISGESFLWHMVRCIATALLRCGNGVWDESYITAHLTGNCTNKLPPAPPDGLILWDTDCGFSWKPVVTDRRTIDENKRVIGYHRLMTGIYEQMSSTEHLI